MNTISVHADRAMARDNTSVMTSPKVAVATRLMKTGDPLRATKQKMPLRYKTCALYVHRADVSRYLVVRRQMDYNRYPPHGSLGCLVPARISQVVGDKRTVF
jgi:hypothetical protein